MDSLNVFELLVFNPLWRIGFDPRSVHVRFGVEEMALELVFLRMHRFSPVTVIPPTLHTLCVSLLLRTKEQRLGTFQ